MAIEKPINLINVANTLGYYEYAPPPVTGQTVRKVDLGRLCRHPNINMWAKYKPVRYPVNIDNNQELTEAQMHRQPLAETYHGIYIENSSSPITLRDRIFGLNNKTHEYRRPRGGESEPFRVSDFSNYKQNGGGLVTTSGASGFFGEEMIVNIGGAFDNPPKDVIMTYGGIEPIETDYLLAKQDVYPDGFSHRGIMLTYNGISYWKTGEVNWNDPILKAWFTASTTSIRVDAMQFMTNVKQETLRNATNIPSGGRFYAVLKDSNTPYSDNPYSIIVRKLLAPGTLRYKEPVPFTAVYNPISNRIEFEVVFDASVTEAGGGFLKNIEVVLVRNSDDRWMAMQSLGSYNLVNGEIKIYNGYFTEPYLGMRLILIERSNNRAETDIIQQT